MSHWIVLGIGAIVAVWIWWIDRHSLIEIATWRRRMISILRLGSVGAVALALIGPTCEHTPDAIHLLHVVDVSESVGADAVTGAADQVAHLNSQLRSGDSAGILRFAMKPEVVATPADIKPFESSDSGTFIEDAISAAAALLPGHGHRKIVLHTDGNATRGDSALASSMAHDEGIEVHVVPISRAFTPEVILQTVDAPASATTGEVFNVNVSIASNVATTARIQWFQNRFLAGEKVVELKPGAQDFQLEALQAMNAIEQMEIVVISDGDSLAENNRAQFSVSTTGPPKVLIISDSTEDRVLAQTLEQAAIEVDVRPPQGLPVTVADLENFDLLVFQNVAASYISGSQSEMIRRWVRESGGGFLMLGGESSFGAGGYAASGIEEMLPLRSEHEDARDIPSVALLVILDRSGSMNAPLPSGETKMALANQGAALAFQVLGRDDYFGLFAVDTVVHPVVPLTRSPPVSNTVDRILSVNSAGGGIYVYTSLAEGFRALRQVPAALKHIILFSDAADAEEQFAGQTTGSESGASAVDLVSAMLTESITTSVVALGEETDPHTNFLRSLAQRGGGRFYLTNDALNLPRIFTTETMQVAKSSITEEPLLVTATSVHPMLDGIDWSSAPFLLGYNLTRIQPGADLHLLSENGDPLLATWRYGIGSVAGFTSDASARWASEWLRWPGFGKFWPQVVRSIMRQPDDSGLNLVVERNDGMLSVELSATDAGGAFVNQLDPVIALTTQGGEAALRQTAPGIYTGSIEADPQLSIAGVLQVAGREGTKVFALPPQRDEELLRLEPDLIELQQIADAGGGSVNPGLDQLLNRDGVGGSKRHELAPWLLLLAASFYLSEVFLRRTARRPQATIPKPT